MSDAVLFIDEVTSSYAIDACRICPEHELESCKGWKPPVLVPELSSLHTEIAYRDGAMKRATQLVKFAYRNSNLGTLFHLKVTAHSYKSNRECSVTGFKSMYNKTMTEHFALFHRESLVVLETENSRGNLGTDYAICISAADNGASFCRSLALIFTVLLLIRQSFDVLTEGLQAGFPFSILTVLIVKAVGIIVPICILIRTVAFVRNIRQYRHQHQNS